MTARQPARTPRRMSTRTRVAHLSVDERAARGKAARTEVPRSSHAGFEPLPERRNPLEILQAQAATRVPDLVPLRYGRMVANPFAFYRGAAAIMAADLATTADSGLRSQLCGDAHLVNFGMYFSADRRLVFDINDFDETLPGPWEWDVKRLAASIAVAGRAQGFSDKDRATAVLRTVAGYRQAMTRFAGMRNLEIWYARLDIDNLLQEVSAHLDQRRLKLLRGVRDKAAGRDNLQAFGKLTEVVDGEPRFASVPPLVVPISELAPQYDPNATVDMVLEAVREVMRSYRTSLSDDHRRLVEQFRFVDLARKVVGVGSVGTRAWIALMLGRDGADPLIIQVKEAQTSVLEPYVGRSRYPSAGRRVVAGQRLMQASSDIFLGWHRGIMWDGVQRDFYFRQLKDGKGGFDPTTFKPEGLALYGNVCGWTLARAHARSGDAIAISAYLGRSLVFDRALADFAEAYADQNERDHALLVEAVRSGQIEAIEGV